MCGHGGLRQQDGSGCPLSAAIYKLLPVGIGADAAVMKAQLRSMREALFQWPSPDEVRPEALPPLPKNIAKNFTGVFFCSSGRDLVCTEV